MTLRFSTFRLWSVYDEWASKWRQRWQRQMTLLHIKLTRWNWIIRFLNRNQREQRRRFVVLWFEASTVLSPCNFHTSLFKQLQSPWRGKPEENKKVHGEKKSHDWAPKIPTKFRTWAITRDRICSVMFSNKCLDLGLHIDHDDDAGRSKSKQVFNLFLRINIHHQLVCIQNIPWLLVLSIESHLKWRYSVLREPFAHTTVSNLYSIYVSDTRDKKFKLYVFLHLRKGGNAQVSSGIVCYPYPYQWCDPKSGSKFW